ncbi:FAD binding protein [Chthonomonas calidirosea]|uniref:FAD binding domain n=1 Tax=Chthonomonas calidirosea (strain DSM 23976 / ICMP 18418 / T49) TaxID=1303518 RepID=S0ETY7_CHTCT|nr:FAD binding domain [Chthonomonas calidirosea]CCW34707.1 FAD binding domain [Chthonomonas calidirosea T49]CEK14021.1 FAD binding protein [Chthonomonas calidirosea]
MDFDIAIVGSGFGGSILGMIARRLGYRVLLVERGTHPRFAIGESTSPLFNLLLEETAERYDLPVLRILSAYGSWQRTYPQVACGLKRGFTFFEHIEGRHCNASTDPASQLMVAASPCDEVADTHWYRADVDALLVEEAQRMGVDYTDHTDLVRLQRQPGGGWRLEGERLGKPMVFSCRFVVDASGPRGFLSRAFVIPNRGFSNYPKTQAVYTHFTDVRRCETVPDYVLPCPAPYPMDDAAVHHLFNGGWIWVLRFNNGITSAGAALDETLAVQLGVAADPEGGWKRLLARYPSLQELFDGAQTIRPFIFVPSLPWRSQSVVGEGWAMLPSAMASIDPLFSTGFPLNLLGILRLATIWQHGLEESHLSRALPIYAEVALAEADFTARYVAACRKAMGCFPLFAALSMFYFAAASFSEMARRLRRPNLAAHYMAEDRKDFMEGWARCEAMLDAVLEQPTPAALLCFERAVAEAVENLNVAGLCDPHKQNRYGVDFEDVVRGAEKLGFTPETIREIIKTAPWAQGC